MWLCHKLSSTFSASTDVEELVAQIRQKLGFSRFFTSQGILRLKRAAQFGPIVIINASRYGCDAFIILPWASPLVVPLRCSLKDLRSYQTKFRETVRNGFRSRQEELENSSRKAVPAFNLN